MFQWCLQIKIKYVVPLVFSLICTYWMFGISTYELVPQWHITISTSRFYPFHIRKVDKDIKLYAITENNNFRHYVIPFRRRRRPEILPELLPMHDISLPSEIQNVVSFDVRQVKGMQLIIVLCGNSLVYAVNEHFEIMWRSNVFSNTKGYSNIVETGFVRFSNTCISPSKCDFVFIGASLRPSSQQEASEDHGHHADSSEKHMSTVAFDAESGNSIWHHFPYDYGEGLEDEGKRLTPSIRHHWKLQILRRHLRMEHIDERPWVTYLPFFFKLLPYSWVTTSDTEALQTNLRHHRVEAYEHMDKKDAKSPHKGRANVIVVRHEKGLEVLDLFTGKPRSQLEMEGGLGRTFYPEESRLLMASLETSLNASGVFCSLKIIPRSNRYPASSHSHQQWNDICEPVGILGTPRPNNHNYREDPAKVVPPVVIESLQRWPQLFRMLGFGFAYRNVKNIITLVSDGTLSSYSSDGKTNWRANIPATWLSVSRDLSSGDISPDSAIKKRYDHIFVPSLTSLKSSDSLWMLDAVIAAGWSSVAVVDAKSGVTAASHDLPCQPIHHPVVIDDQLILVCDSMIIGFYMNIPLRIGTFIMVFVGFAFISMIAVCCLDPNSIFWEIVD